MSENAFKRGLEKEDANLCEPCLAKGKRKLFEIENVEGKFCLDCWSEKKSSTLKDPKQHPHYGREKLKRSKKKKESA